MFIAFKDIMGKEVIVNTTRIFRAYPATRNINRKDVTGTALYPEPNSTRDESIFISDSFASVKEKLCRW